MEFKDISTAEGWRALCATVNEWQGGEIATILKHPSTLPLSFGDGVMGIAVQQEYHRLKLVQSCKMMQDWLTHHLGQPIQCVFTHERDLDYLTQAEKDEQARRKAEKEAAEREYKEREQQALMKRMREASRIPAACWQGYALKTFERLPGTEQAWSAICKFTYRHEDMTELTDEEWTNYDSGHHFLTLAGKFGTGKTRLAIGAAMHVCQELEEWVIYWQVAELLEALRDSLRADDGEYTKILKATQECELLVLDDIGAQKATEWANERLDSLVDHRYIHSKRTIFTTNAANAEDLGGRIASRIQEGEVVILKCQDYRKLIAAKRKAVREAVTK